MMHRFFAILWVVLILCPVPAAADDAPATPPPDDPPAEPAPAGANASVDVSDPTDPPSDTTPPASPEVTPDPSTQPIPDTLRQMRWIESLPLVLPPHTAPHPTDPSAREPMDMPTVLNHRMNELLAEPEPAADPLAVQTQLMALTDNAAQLALVSDAPAQQFEALHVQMQALYAQMVDATETAEVDRLLSRLRSAARRTKAIDLPQAQPVGDFWLLTAELFDLNRTPLPPASRREQAAQLMAKYLADHPEAPPSTAVRTSYRDLQSARGIDIDPAPPIEDPQTAPPDAPAEPANP